MIPNNSRPTWTADNGNGTFTNPLFYDEFSDPDLIRVGDDYYLTGTTMHCMPGLPVLHSKDLVNWTLLGYVFDRLDLGPEFRLEDGKQIYGQGIWAPSFRYHNGTFYIFSSINRHTTQVFRATDPAGPWTRTAMDCFLHDLSVLFDDDGQIYVVWGYREMQFARVKDDFTGLVPGSQRSLFDSESLMGEGAHFYKVKGKYYITGAWFSGRMRMPCARADHPEGPYEVNPEISADEDFGLCEGLRLKANQGPPFELKPREPRSRGRMSLHQGGIVETGSGDWWGFSMMDYNSVGRLTCLSPVTWQNGWPYFGLPGNLGRTPRTWVKPETGFTSTPTVPFERSDDFSDRQLKPIWQWNHLPDDGKWALEERPGFMRLHSLPAPDFWLARNTLTQRAIGPISIATAELDATGMEPGDTAGLALLNFPYAWIGVRREAGSFVLEQFDQTTGETSRVPLQRTAVQIRAECDFLTEKANFSYSTDGKRFTPLGPEFAMIFQTVTFQGVRFSLFHFNSGNAAGGYADFDTFTVEEPHPRGLMRPIPFGKFVTLATAIGDSVLVSKDGRLAAVPTNDPLAKSANSRFEVVDRGLGRVALRSNGGFVSVSGSQSAVTVKLGDPTDAEAFQWTETPYGDLVLLSIVTHRLLRVEADAIYADSPGPHGGDKDKSSFRWE